MQPLPTRLRKALIKAHPGLAHRDLDELDRLTLQWHHALEIEDPSQTSTARSALKKFIQKRMPRFHEIVRDEQERFVRSSTMPTKPPPVVTEK